MPERMRRSGKLVAAPLDAGEVAVDVHRLHPSSRRDLRAGGRTILGTPFGEVDVFGERDGGQPHLECAAAGVLHGGVRTGIPGELRVHVVVGGKHAPCFHVPVPGAVRAFASSDEAHSGTVGVRGYEGAMALTRIPRTMATLVLTASVATACVGVPTAPRAAAPSEVTGQTPPTPGWTPGDGPSYVAMGDSAASAPLVPPQAQPAGCLKSTNDYPSVFASRIGAASFADVTCSGARTEDLVSRAQPTRTGQVPPQLDAVTADTQLVTVTIGGNDVDLPRIAMTCRRSTLDLPPCSSDLVVDGVDRISQAIDSEADQWAALVGAIRSKAPEARVILVGYGTYVRPQGCFPAQPINPVDAAYFQSKLDELDGRLRQVAAQQGVEFFDTRPMSVGHDICAAPQDRFVEGFAPERPAAPLHPNGAGAAAFGSALADYVTSVPAGG